MSVRHLEYLFRPESVAVIGASNRPNSVGNVVMRNLLRGGFDGPILPVNPREQAISGVLAYKDVESLPIVPDLAVVCTPPKTVPQVIEALGNCGTKGVVALTAGLSQVMGDAGQTIQDLAREGTPSSDAYPRPQLCRVDRTPRRPQRVFRTYRCSARTDRVRLSIGCPVYVSSRLGAVQRNWLFLFCLSR